MNYKNKGKWLAKDSSQLPAIPLFIFLVHTETKKNEAYLLRGGASSEKKENALCDAHTQKCGNSQRYSLHIAKQ